MSFVVEALDTVIDAVVDVVDWAVDEVIEPVLDATGDVIEGFLDDPIKTIAKVTAYATGNAWAIPLIDGVDVALAGGDLGDVLTATAVSYAAGEAGAYVGEVASDYIGSVATAFEYGTDIGSAQTAQLLAQDVGLNTLTTALTQISGAAAGSAASSVVVGGDPLDAAFTGALQSGLTFVKNELSGSAGASAYNEQPPEVQSVIDSAVSTVLSGGDLTSAAVEGAVSFGETLADASAWVNQTLQDMGLDADTATRLQTIGTSALANAYSAAFQGGDVNAAINATLSAAGYQALGDKLVEFGTEVFDDITGAYDNANNYATAIEGIEGSIREVADQWNSLADAQEAERLTLIDERDALDVMLAKHNANPTRASRDAYNAALKRFVDRSDAYLAKVEPSGEYGLQFAEYEKQITQLNQSYEEYLGYYQTAEAMYTDAWDVLDVFADEATDAAKTDLVNGITGGEFNADWYAQVNDIPMEDAVEHYIQVGQYAGLTVNATQEADRYDFLFNKYANEVLNSERTSNDLTSLSPEDMALVTKRLKESFSNSVDLTVAINEGMADETAFDLMDSISANGGYNGAVVDGNTRVQLEALGYTNLEDGAALTTQQKYDLYVTNPNYVSGSGVTLPEGLSYTDIAVDPAKYYIDYSSGTPTWSDATTQASKASYDPKIGAYFTDTQVVNNQLVETVTVYNNAGEKITVLASDKDQLADVDFYNVGLDELYSSGGLDSINWVATSTEGETEIEVIKPLDVNISATREPVLAGLGSLTGDQIYDFLTETFTEMGDLSEVLAEQESADNQMLMEALGLTDLANYLGGESIEYVAKFNNWLADSVAEEESEVYRGLAGAVILAGGNFVAQQIQTLDYLSDPTLSDRARELQEATIKLSADVSSDIFKDGAATFNSLFNPQEGEEGYIDPNWSPLSKGVMGAINLANAISEEPEYFLYGVLGSEVLEEVPGIVAGLVTGGTAKTLLQKATNLGTAFATRVGTTIGITTETSLDISEAFGGTYLSTYENTYNEAKAAGFSEEEAIAAAEENAANAGYWAGTLAGVVSAGGTLAGTDISSAIIQRQIVGAEADALNGAIDTLAGSVQKRLNTVGYESLSEAVEEGVVAGVSGTYIQGNINPEYDVVTDVINNSLLASVVGAGTSTTLNLADIATDLTTSAGKTVIDQVYRTYSPTYAEAVDTAIASGDPSTVNEVLNNYGITDSTAQLEINNTYFDDSIQTLDEVYAQTQSNYDYFDFQGADLTQFTGYDTTAEQVDSGLGEYVDPRYTDIEEAASMFEAANGYKPTAEELQAFVGQGDENFEAESTTAVNQYVDPRQITTEEAQAFFDSQGYVPTQEELAQFVGQGDENFQTTTGTQVDEYVDPRQVTYDEAVEMFKAYTGFDYTPTPEELQSFVGQGGADFVTNQQTGIDQYIDDNSVTGEEYLDYALESGYNMPEGIDLSYLSGQYAESTLSDRFSENEGVMTFNVLTNQIDEVANLLGKPPEQVTQFDLDTVSAWLQQPTPDQYTDYQLGYDVNNDGQITQEDYDLITGSNVADLAAMAEGSRYGQMQDLYGYNTVLQQDLAYQQDQNAQQQLEAQQQMEQNLQQQMQQNLEQQMQQQQDLALENQRMGNLNSMMQMIMGAEDVNGQQVSVRTPDPARINYVYDFSSVFATPQQAGMFASPYGQYAKGGQVKSDDDDDEFYRLVGA